MGITIKEFQTAMETFGAKRLKDRKGARYLIDVPCFKVKDTVFLHSGSYYVVQRGKKASESIMDQAMKVLGEEHPGKNHFWYEEIHSIKGMLALALILEEKYSREKLYELTNKTYEKLLDSSAIKSKPEVFCIRNPSLVLLKLYRAVEEFDRFVNPFTNANLEFKEPKDYLNKVHVKIGVPDKENNLYITLHLISKKTEVRYNNDPSIWSYSCYANTKKAHIEMIHYYDKKSDDEVVYLDMNMIKEDGNWDFDNPNNIDLRISLKTGFAWKTHEKDKPITSATDEQINLFISYLKFATNQIKSQILEKIIEVKD